MPGWAVAVLDLLFPAFCAVCRAALGDGRRDPLCGRCWASIERIAPPLCAVCGRPLRIFGSEREVSPDRAWAVAAARGDVEPATDRARVVPHGGGKADAHTPGAHRGAVIADAPGVAGPLAGADSLRCPACAIEAPAFDYARAAGVYAGPLREALHALKFQGKRAVARPLVDLIVRQCGPAITTDVAALVPVPLARNRARGRGFNQAELIGEGLAAALGIPVRRRWLARTRETRPQTDLPAAERRANVQHAFAARHAIGGLHVVLVDDVLTTGATAAECARALYAAGAARVGVLTVARAL